MPGAFASFGANASRFDEDASAGATAAIVADAQDSIVADAIVAQAVIAHSVIADSVAGDARHTKAPTHWTRILYYDFMDGNTGSAPRVETARAEPESSPAWHHRSPLVQGAVLLAIYIAMYVAVAIVIHVLPALDGAGRESIRSDSALAETSLRS
jgi:hypothetical protein